MESRYGEAVGNSYRGQKLTNEREVIAQVLSGQVEEFAVLVRANENQIFELLLHQLGDEQVARELAQDTFLRAYRHLHTFRGDSSFSTWLIRIALNRARSYFASRAFRQRSLSEPLGAELPADMSSAQDAEQEEERLTHLRLLVGGLRPKLRDTLVLCVFERKSYQEAADILGVPYGTICSRMNAALQLLRKKMMAGQ